jgi:hypothetical protein
MFEALLKIWKNEGRFTAAEYGIATAMTLIVIEKMVMNI